MHGRFVRCFPVVGRRDGVMCPRASQPSSKWRVNFSVIGRRSIPIATYNSIISFSLSLSLSPSVSYQFGSLASRQSLIRRYERLHLFIISSLAHGLIYTVLYYIIEEVRRTTNRLRLCLMDVFYGRRLAKQTMIDDWLEGRVEQR